MGFKIENNVLIKYEQEPGVTEVVIPESVTKIGDLAFNFCDSFTIHAPAESFAEQYAERKQIPFVAE